MTTSTRRLIRVGTVAAAVLLAGSLTLPGAAAQPVDDESVETTTSEEVDAFDAVPVEQTVTLDFPTLGLDTALEFRDSVVHSVSIPVPAGRSLRTLTGLLHSFEGMGDGYLDITTTGGRYLGSLDLPDAASSQRTIAFSVDISGVAVESEFGALSMTVRGVDGQRDVCGPQRSLTASEMAVTYAGSGTTPTTVQQFFPSVLRAIDIHVDPSPTAAEKQSVLDLTASVVHNYGDVPVAVNVVPLDRSAGLPAAGDPLRRAVVVRDGTDTAAAQVTPVDGGAVLVLSGSGATLPQQVGAFSRDLDQLIQTPSGTVTGGLPDTGTVLGTDTLTFGQLGASASASVLGSATLFSGFDSSTFGFARPESVDIHLLADHTPVGDGAAATLTVSSGNSVVYAQELDASGRVDTTFTLTGGAIGRTVGVDMVVTYSPNGGCAAPPAPMSFSVDPQSTATASGTAPAGGGFAVLPSALMPTFQVGFDTADSEADGLTGLAFAARSVAGMQSMAPSVLRPIVTPLDQVVASSTGALVVADGTALAASGMTPPVAVVDGEVSVGGRDRTTLDISGGVGSVQVFVDRGRTVLAVTTTGPWSLVNPVLDASDRGEGWSALTGDVLAAGAGGVAVPLTVVTDGSQAIPAPSGWRLWAWIGVAAGAVVVVALGIGWWRSSRRARGSLGG